MKLWGTERELGTPNLTNVEAVFQRRRREVNLKDLD